MNYKAFLGIDVSKLTLDVVLVHPEDERGVHQKFDNTSKGFSQLFKWISKNRKISLQEVFFCLEHTGVYALPIATELQQRSLNYCMEMALRIKKSMGVSRIKNDKADAKVIALYAMNNHKKLRVNNLPAKELLKIKNLLAFRERLSKTHQGLKHAYGELEKFTDKDVQSIVPSESKKVIKYVAEKIRKVDELIEQIIRSVPELEKNYQLIKTVDGIGPRIAANMIVCTNNFNRFETWRQFSCYSGIAPFEHSSGTSVRRANRVSPLANKSIKRLLTMGAWTSMKANRELRLYYERKVAEGKPKLSALNAVKNKLVSRMFAVISRGTPFIRLPLNG
jgi:transposase